MTDNEILSKLENDIIFRGYTSNTKDKYTCNIMAFKKYINKPLKNCTEYDFKEFIQYLFYEKKLSKRTINNYNSSIRFLFDVTLEKNINKKQIPFFKYRRNLPEILTKDELQQFFSNCNNLKHKAIFMTIYGGGLRISEAIKLRVQDIDSKQMRIFVGYGKGEKQRYTILSEENLKILREYYKQYRPKHPDGYLFLGFNTGTYVTRKSVELAFIKWCKEVCNIQKNVSVHSLRHGFATNLYEQGVDIFKIKELLGHATLRATVGYIHLSNFQKDITSPLDILVKEGDNNA